MNAFKKLTASSLYLGIPVLAMFLLCPTGVRAQYLIVDCTGANPSAYLSINAALPNATPGSFILVTGPCNESVSLYGQNALNLGAYYGQTATINGSISINNSQNIFLYGLNVTNTAGNGISVSNSRSISLNVCSSSGNAGVGLSVGGMSDVTIGASGAFSHNGAGGMNITGNSTVGLVAWAGPVDISNNVGAGVAAFQGNFNTLGPTTITNNTFNGTFNPGYGLDLRGGGRAQIGALFGPNVISGNPGGGASLQEKRGDLLLEYWPAQSDPRQWAGGSPGRIRQPGDFRGHQWTAGRANYRPYDRRSRSLRQQPGVLPRS